MGILASNEGKQIREFNFKHTVLTSSSRSSTESLCALPLVLIRLSHNFTSVT
jgi:hypothetical protein